MSVLFNNLLGAGANQGPRTEHIIERSLQFTRAHSSFLERTPSSAGNSKTWTFSCWIKRTGGNREMPLLFVQGVSLGIVNNKLTFREEQTPYQHTLQYLVDLYDTSAWYHLILSIDTSRNNNRAFINGKEVPLAGNLPAPWNTTINSTATHFIGKRFFTKDGKTSTIYGSDLLADVYLIDGQALASQSFGFFDTNNNWQPRAYPGTFGTNGFHLTFKPDKSNQFGVDSSPNSNNWKQTNFGLSDSLVDSPTDGKQNDTGKGGEVSGNYATLNPFYRGGLDEGNLRSTSAMPDGTPPHRYNDRGWRPGPITPAVSSIAVTSGKWYFESNMYKYERYKDGKLQRNYSDYWSRIGFINLVTGQQYYLGPGNFNNTFFGGNYAGGVSNSPNRPYGLAVDFDSGSVIIYNNTASKTASFGFNRAHPHALAIWGNRTVNFGQKPFSRPAPTGYKCLCTANLPDTAVKDGSRHMGVVTYTGNGSSQAVTGFRFAPDLLWLKSRARKDWHFIYDRLRGSSLNIYPNAARPEDRQDSSHLTSLDNSGFTLGSSRSLNRSKAGYVGWAWSAGDSAAKQHTFTSDAGDTITATVKADQTAGLSITSFTAGSKTTVTTRGSFEHGLGKAPHFVMIKALNRSDEIALWSNSFKNTGFLNNLPINNVAVDNTKLTMNLLGNGTRFIVYAWTSIEGYSKFSTLDQAFNYTGFRVRYLLIGDPKNSNWFVFDSARDVSQPRTLILSANSAASEYTKPGFKVDFLSNGFKLQGGLSPSSNIFYAAFGEHPFKSARGR